MLSLRNILLAVGIFAALFAVLAFAKPELFGIGASNGPKGDVVLWGTLPEGEMNSITQVFNPKAKTYAVRYKYVPESEFNQRLLEALANQNGPDAIIAPYQIILSQEDRIYPYPFSSLSEKTFRDSYVDGASVFLSPNGALALPVSIDPMVLFYNRSMFSKHGIVNPPAYWDELSQLTPTLTIRNKHQFTESAISLGTPNTKNAKDIIMTIVHQLGQSPIVRTTGGVNGYSYFSVQVNEEVNDGSGIFPLSTVNRFFTQFADPNQINYTWNDLQGDPVDAFLGEKVAMYIGYASELATLRSRNPRAILEMTYLPQTKGYNTFVTGMKMYGVSVLRTSRNPSASFAVTAQFAGVGVAPALANILGAQPPFRSYVGTQGLDPVLSRSMLVARGWYDPFYRETEAYLSTMIFDIINFRYGVTDASNIFVSRLRDLYSSKNK